MEIIGWLLTAVLGILTILSFFYARSAESKQSAKDTALMSAKIDSVKEDTSEIKDRITQAEKRIQDNHDMTMQHEVQLKTVWKRIDDLNERTKGGMK